MLTFLKLGGSLITDKQTAQLFRADMMRMAAHEIFRALAAKPDLKLLLGHGSGSFGHFAAAKYNTIQGVETAEQWRGFAEVALVARRLNSLVMDTLFEVGLPVFAIQPSASALAIDGEIQSMILDIVQTVLRHGLIPVVYGDVAFDVNRGGTIISTETIFNYLAEYMGPARIILAGEVGGVLDANNMVIPDITPSSFNTIKSALGAARGVDVTGGMLSKVSSMLDLLEKVPNLEIHIVDGTQPQQLELVLLGESNIGTRLHGDAPTPNQQEEHFS